MTVRMRTMTIALALLLAGVANRDTAAQGPSPASYVNRTTIAPAFALAAYRWRYQPYYTYYNMPPGEVYSYPPATSFGAGYHYTWPHYGAYGYTYYGPGLSGGW